MKSRCLRVLTLMLIIMFMGACRMEPNSQLTTHPTQQWLIVPVPREISYSGGWLKIVPSQTCSHESGPNKIVYNAIHNALNQVAIEQGAFDELVTCEVNPHIVKSPQGYTLDIDDKRIHLIGHDQAGLFYAAMSLKQLARQSQGAGRLPQVHIEDYPDIDHRGIMMDISRDKVPTMKTLYRFVDTMAEWKLNEFQLYTEHTFAYRGHSIVWEHASPMTPDQIRDLDRYCRDRFITLVPNQNSFGHMNRWLMHKPYRHLAEMPGQADLCPIDPGSIALIENLYNDLLPNFTSDVVNVGCDETSSIGKGRSRDAVQQKGVGQVYLEFLLKIRQLAKNHNKRIQFWGDIINHHPDLIPELKKDMIAMEWGYEANHPFEKHCRRFADSGIQFYVAPGTSSWNSLIGRTDNAMANLRNAAINGKKYGAIGFMITDWGDSGHFQFLPISYGPFLYGAALAWNVQKNLDLDVPYALDVHVFEDSAHVMGKLVYDLGNTYKIAADPSMSNRTVFYGLLLHDVETPFEKAVWLKGLSETSMKKAMVYLDHVMKPLDQAQMNVKDAKLIRQEIQFAVRLVRIAGRLGIARSQLGGIPTSQLPKSIRLEVADDLEQWIPGYEQLWLARNRCGGLSDSAGRFRNLVNQLRQK